MCESGNIRIWDLRNWASENFVTRGSGNIETWKFENEGFWKLDNLEYW